MKRKILNISFSKRPIRHVFFTQVLLVCLMLSGNSCKKLVEVPAPTTSITDKSVFTTDASATAVLTGLYSNLSNYDFYGPGNLMSLSLYAGLSADEFTLWSGITDQGKIAYYQNRLTSSNADGYWIFTPIISCNAAIAGLSASETITPSVKQQLIGEAKFLRAFYFFYLVNLYGEVPLTTSSDYKINATISRSPVSAVYQQIIGDLKDAETLLSADYLDGTLYKTTTERVRPTKWAAAALLARAYLYSKDYAGAEAQATMVINNTTLYKLSDLAGVFVKNSQEAIWQLQPVNSTFTNVRDAYTFIIPPTGPSDQDNPVYLSDDLLNSFELNDKRKVNWVRQIQVGPNLYSFPYKYKVNITGAAVTEYSMVLRLGEQFLIRAEARANLSNISGAQSDLNQVRNRAGLNNTSANSQSDLITGITHERRVELFTEMGHRWLDLKRLGLIDAVMSSVTMRKGNTWKSFQQLYPIQVSELQRNVNLKQNAGY